MPTSQVDVRHGNHRAHAWGQEKSKKHGRNVCGEDGARRPPDSFRIEGSKMPLKESKERSGASVCCGFAVRGGWVPIQEGRVPQLEKCIQTAQDHAGPAGA